MNEKTEFRTATCYTQPVAPMFSDALLNALAEAPRNRWLVIDVIESTIVGAYEDSVLAVQQALKEQKGLLVVWCGPGGLDLTQLQAKAA